MKRTVEDKIRNFEIALYEDVASSHAENLAETRKRLRKEETQAKKAAGERRAQIEERTVKKTSLMTMSAENKAREEARMGLMAQKNLFCEKLFDLLEERLENMPKEDYQSFLKKEIKSSLGYFDGSSLVVRASGEDLKFLKGLLSSLKREAVFEEFPSKEHKGVVLEDGERTKRVSITIEELLMSKRESLMELIEKELQEEEN